MSATTEFTFSATTRHERGSANARRLRRVDQVPAIVYGADKPPQALALAHKAVIKTLSHHEVFSQIVSLEIDGQAEQVVIKDLLRHPTKPKIEHMDFLRVDANQKMTMHVPLHFVDEEDCPGVKEGGVVSHLLQDVEVICLPKDLPQSIELSLAHLEMDHSLHLSDILLPEGVELVAELDEEHNPTVVSVHKPKVEVEEEPESEGNDEGEVASDDEGEAAASDDTANKEA